jgi:hypothetical protein
VTGIAGWCCGACGGDKFPEGIRLVYCPACDQKIHAGCWPRHEQEHLRQDPDAFRRQPARPGVVGAYGVIRWLDAVGKQE